MPALWKVGVVIFLWLLCGRSNFVIAARSMSIVGDKTSLDGDEYLTLTASSSGFTDGEVILIKGAFFQDGSTNYFGYTKKDSDWINNGDPTVNQRSVVVGQWDQTMMVKSNFSDSGFKGEGEYRLKLGYYYKTGSGENSSVNWSTNSLIILLNEPDPTPTNSPTPTNTPSATPQPTSTHTPTPTSKSTNTPSQKPSIRPTEKIEANNASLVNTISSSSQQINMNETILGAENTNTSTSSVTMERTPSKKVFIITSLFIGIGSALLSLVFVLRKQFFNA